MFQSQRLGERVAGAAWWIPAFRVPRAVRMGTASATPATKSTPGIFPAVSRMQLPWE